MTLHPLVGSFLILLVEWLGSRATKYLPAAKLEVGPATTVVRGPLKSDGTIDYEAAYNARASVGVTPENNAVVLVSRAFGPQEIPVELRPRFYRYLGIEEPKETGDWFVDQEDFAKQLIEKSQLAPDKSEELSNEIATATSKVWKRYEFPRVVAWIERNEPSLQVLEQASLRSKFYLPWVTTAKLEDALLPWVNRMRQVLRLLSARAMLRISEHDFDGAADDLLTCQRLGRLIGQNPSSICKIVACAFDAVVIYETETLLAQSLFPEQVARYQADFLFVTDPIDIENSLDLGERFMGIDGTLRLWRERGLVKNWIDVNVALRHCNAYYDGLIRAHRTAGYRNRINAFTKLQNEMSRNAKSAMARGSSLDTFWDSRKAVNESFAALAVALSAPAADRLQITEDRTNMRRELMKSAFALAGYFAKNQCYPDRLQELVPDYLSEIPQDLFIDQPLHYQRRRDGYLLYSVGDDEKDDLGRRWDSNSGDLIFQVIQVPSLEDAEWSRRMQRDIAKREQEQFEFNLRIFGALLFLVAVWVTWRLVVLMPGSKLIIGPDTTVVDGPLSPLGTLDFEAAIHNRSSIGITVDNNAAVLLVQTFGPQTLSPELKSRYYGYLGISEPTGQGRVFCDEEAYLRSLPGSPDPAGEAFQALLQEFSRGLESPWKRTELPLVADWIAFNETPVQLIEQAGLRPKYYVPMVNDGPLWEAPNPLLNAIGAVVRFLATRIMLQIAEGDLEGALNDLLTCHRLASLLGQNSTAAGNLVGFSIDAVAVHCGQFLLAQPLTMPQIERFRSELSTLPPIGNVAETLENRTRLEMLDGLQLAASDRQLSRRLLGFERFSLLDVNQAFRRSNAYFDALRPILQSQDTRQRMESLNKFQIEMAHRAGRSAARLGFIPRLAWRSRVSLTQGLTDVILSLMVPDVRQLQLAQDQAVMRRELLRVGLELAAYRATHGAYPQDLDALGPRLINGIPQNGPNGQPIHYQVLPTGYLLIATSDSANEEGDLAFQVTHS